MTTAEFRTKVIEVVERLRPIALNLTRDEEDANDLAQETMYKALSNQDKFKTGTNLQAWLYTIMKNIFINDYRRQKKRGAMVDNTESYQGIENAAVKWTNEGEHSMHMKDIDKALNKISSAYSHPFLRHYEGYKYDEIAEELNLPVGTVKSRIHLARKQLQKKLLTFRTPDKI